MAHILNALSMILLMSRLTTDGYSIEKLNSKVDKKIYGGDYVKIIDVPYQVAVKRSIPFPENNSETVVFPCGGTIMNEYWVATVARCITHDPVIIGWRYTVYMGIEDLEEVNNKDTQVHKAAVIRCHPDFDGKTLLNDICFLGFAEKIQFSDKVKPVRLPVEGEERKFLAGNVSGYGSPHETIPPGKKGKLKAATMWIVPDDYCTGFLGLEGFYWNFDAKTMLCAGVQSEFVIMPCTGDYGGGFVARDDKGQDVLLGIINKWPYKLLSLICIPHAHFTKVTPYLSWINKFINTKPWR